MMAISVDNRFPLSFYYVIADNIIKEAEVYREEGDMEGLCQALNRYTRVISDVIPHHRSYSVHSNEMLHHKKILHGFAKELESMNLQFGINNDGISRFSTGCYKQRGSVSHISHNGQKDKSFGFPGKTRISRTKSSTSPHEKDAKLVYATDTGTSSSYAMLQSSSAIVQDVDINVHAVKHYFPSPALSCVEAPPVIGQVSHVTFSEPNKLYVESSCEESSSSKATKDVHISAGLMEEFMELAKANTEKDLETCGILGASLKNHIYYITALVMPKQESTSNSCQALNEEEIHAILDGESLYPAGWIHTHPSQTCFLSSIDLHTQFSYQVMLPEAVAIVMAPTDSERKSGIFRLSDPGGINVLRQCLERGFHPHRETADGSPIYENCSNVYINPSLRFEIFDMRLQCSD